MEELDKLEKARDSMHDVRFPGEEDVHRAARDAR